MFVSVGLGGERRVVPDQYQKGINGFSILGSLIYIFGSISKDPLFKSVIWIIIILL